MPDDIKSFGDIKLKDFHNLDGCNSEDSKYKQTYSGSINEGLFYEYAELVKKMIKDSEDGKKITNITKELFKQKKY